MKTLIKLISLLSLLFLVALPVHAQSAGNVELSLSPATGPIYITTGTDIQIVLKPQGRDIIAVDFGLSYVGSDLVLSDGAPNASYDYFKTGNEGDWRITYTRQFGKPMPASDQEGKVILGTVHLTPSASKQSGSVLVRVIAPPGYSAPKITLLDKSQVADAQITAGSGTYDIGNAPPPTDTPTPSPTPTPLPACTANDLILEFRNTTTGSFVSPTSPSLARTPGSVIFAKAFTDTGADATGTTIEYRNADVPSFSPYPPAGVTIGSQDIIFRANRSGFSGTGCNITATISAAAAPTPTASPVKPTLNTPSSGATIIPGSPIAFAWTQMSNPGGVIKAVGLRVVKADAIPTNNGKMGCANAVIDEWWYTTGNPITPCASAGQKQANEVAPTAFPTSFSGQTLSPGTYYAAVFNLDTTGYHCSMNCEGSGSDFGGFTTTQLFTVSCPVSSPVWDSTGSRCIAARPSKYALSEDLNDLSEGSIGSHWTAYSDTPTIVSHTFSNVTIGQVRTIFVRFKDEQGNINPPLNRPPISKSIKYLGANPEISNVSCNFNSETGTGSKVTITGSNFGSAQGKGGVKVLSSSGVANTTITSWGKVVIQPTREPVFQGGITGTVTPTIALSGTPTVSPTIPLLPTLTITPTVSPTDVLGESTDLTGTPTVSPTGTLTITPTGIASAQTQDRIAVRVKERLGGTVNIELTVDDGRKVTASCAVDTNTVSFATRTQCRPAGNFAEDKVRVQIYEKTPNARPLYDSKASPVSIDGDGTPGWTPPPLEIGKTYNLIIKAPKSLAVKREFTVLEGTNVLDDISFPVGDIAPLNAPDGVVNAVDKSELIREWSATTDVARAGDFNMDGRINSLDYSCMRENINRAADQFIKN
ncbi:hypothetical protein A3J21_02615 [Candidatus Daviesbacteria bacterium RIFCSPLOWO2_02_FULL_43_11]|nr:MAG: hypothetical protein A3J21_02615 [Candidatus Daviesbacteria bacterium RIFCSPLOWO2_02_FULL_43_11]